MMDTWNGACLMSLASDLGVKSVLEVDGMTSGL
jgi:hypothetical protein